MKKIVFLIFLLPLFIFGQVGIGTTTPNAALQIQSSNQATPTNTDGILIPKVNTFPGTNPGANQDGMLVYLTTAVTFASINYSEGFHYWENTAGRWIPITSIERINDLFDGKSDVDGTDDGSSIFLGLFAGTNDDSSHNKNIGIGYQALRDVVGADVNNPDGQNNVAIGFQSLRLNTSGRQNIAVGSFTLDANTIGFNNVAIGNNALTTNVDGIRNTAIGVLTLQNNTSGRNNTAIGGQTLSANTTGQSNVAVGSFTLTTNTVGINNVAMGNQGLRFNNFGSSNVAIGDYAGRALDDDNVADNNNDRNVYIGGNAGNSDLDASNNVYIGYDAGAGDYNPEDNSGTSESKSGNVFIGYQSGFNEINSDRLYIENSNAGQNGALIYGRFDNDLVRINGELQISNPGANNGYAFPLVDGTVDQILVTDGAGQLTFEDQAPDVSTFPIIRANLTANQALATTGWQKIAFNNVNLNPTMSTEFDTANNRFSAATTGIYRIDASFHTVNSQTNTQYYGIAVYINGTLYQEYSINHYYNGTSSSQVARQISCVANVTAGQTIEIYVNNNQAGVSLDAFSGKTHFTIERIR